jgi:hypothetical protein
LLDQSSLESAGPVVIVFTNPKVVLPSRAAAPP